MFMRNERYKGRKVIWESKTKQVYTILICFIFTFIALWIRDTEKPQFWVSIVLFGFGGVFMLVRFLNPKKYFCNTKIENRKRNIS